MFESDSTPPPGDRWPNESSPKLGQHFDTLRIEMAATGTPESPPPVVAPIRQRRRSLPLILFVLTCFSTFLSGSNSWMPSHFLAGAAETSGLMALRRNMIHDWPTGLVFMGCLLVILLTHEMGHFIATLLHKVPASYPYFLPLPFHSFGTLGAVIAMDGSRADRREIFDIGIAGPIAGLVVAIPIFAIGLNQLDFNAPAIGPVAYELPLGAKLVLNFVRPNGYEPGLDVFHGQLNPFFMAGWLGMLVTGLNMMPVSQLDGGHILYALLRKRSHLVAKVFLGTAVSYVVWQLLVTKQPSPWSLMVILVSLMGALHPPTRDDSVPLGPVRTTLGWLSLLIPLLCFPLHGFKIAP